MGQAIAVRADFTAVEVRRLAKRAKDAAQARRLLAIAAVLDGASREGAAKIGGMDRQTLRDWVIRFNDQGPNGLINIPSPGVPPKLGKKHRAFLARLVEEGPIPAVHGVVRWRACDLIMRLYEEFRLSVSDDTIYRVLKDLGFSHVSARPKAYKQDPDAMEAFKKTLPTAWRKSVPSSRNCTPRLGCCRSVNLRIGISQTKIARRGIAAAGYSFWGPPLLVKDRNPAPEVRPQHQPMLCGAGGSLGGRNHKPPPNPLVWRPEP